MIAFNHAHGRTMLRAATKPAVPPIPLPAGAQPSRSCAASGAVNLASLSKTLARNRKPRPAVIADYRNLGRGEANLSRTSLTSGPASRRMGRCKDKLAQYAARYFKSSVTTRSRSSADVVAIYVTTLW
jgi:hypothetical protein